MGIKIGKMLSFRCEDCCTHRAYGEAAGNSDKPHETEPRLTCSTCKRVTLHKFASVESYKMTYDRHISGAITNAEFARLAS